MFHSPDATWRQKRAQEFEHQMPASVGALLAEAAQRFGENLAINFFERGQQLSFRELDNRVSELASGFREIGVLPKMHVGVMLSNTIDFPVAWLAFARMGAVMVPINPAYTATELDFLINDADVQFLVLEQDVLSVVRQMKKRPECLTDDRLVFVGPSPTGLGHLMDELIANGSADFVPDAVVEQSSLMEIQYTSGTTGFPKGCMQSHRFWMLCGFNHEFNPDVYDTGAIISDAPFFYLDSQWMVMRTLCQGTPFYQSEKMSRKKYNQRLVATNVELAFTPTLLPDEPHPMEREHNVRVFRTTGMSRTRILEVERRYGARVREGFGMTEIGLALRVPFHNDDDSVLGTCGFPLPLYDVKVMDAEGIEAPVNTPGELWVRSPGMMDGYWNNPRANAESIVDGWFRTGDIFVRQESGCFKFVGRIKEMIKRSGENISAAEVESVIRQYPGVENVAVVPVPDKLRSEEVKAVIKPRDDVDPALLDPVALRAHCEVHLAKFKCPRFIEWTHEFSYTPSGKIIKRALLEKEDLSIGCWDQTLGQWV